MSTSGGGGAVDLTRANSLVLSGNPSDKSFADESQQYHPKIGNITATAKYVSGTLSIVMLGDASINPTVCDSEITFVPRPRPEPRPEPTAVKKEKTRVFGQCGILFWYYVLWVSFSG